MESRTLHKWARVLARLLWSHSREQLAKMVSQLNQKFPQFAGRIQAILATTDGEGVPEICDEALVLAIQKDIFARQAFEELMVYRYTRKLHSWFHRWGTEVHLVDDLRQQICYKFWKDRLRSFDPARGGFRGFLWRTARNQWIQMIHRQRNLCRLDAVAERPGFEARPDILAQQGELDALILRDIDQLPTEQGKVLRATLQGETPAQIAENMGTTVASVHMRLHRGRSALARSLANMGYERAKGG